MAKKPDTSIPGIVIIDKPAGMTSHDVVSKMRRVAHTRKVGHGGTLDPMATGVLVIGIGQATRLLTYITAGSKAYDATIRFGVAMTTDDAQGQPISIAGCEQLDREALESAMASLRGEIMQVPATVSAIKVDGKRAYALAREGRSVELKARPITIHAFERLGDPRIQMAEYAIATDDDSAEMTAIPVSVVDVDVLVDCSSGTYIRSLARDLGQMLGCGAHLTALRRTRVASFTLSGAHQLADLQAEAEARGEFSPGAPSLPSPGLIPIAEAATSLFPSIVLSAEEEQRFSHGQAPTRDAQEVMALGNPGDVIAACNTSGVLCGVLAIKNHSLKTLNVFSGETQ